MKRWIASVVTVLALGAARETRADTEPPAIPGVSVRLSVFSGAPDLFSLSASINRPRPVAFEAGMSTLILASSFYVRAGGTIPLVNSRDEGGRGWSVFASPMVGYRFFQTVPFDVPDTFHGVSATASAEAVLWLTRHFGLSAQLTAGAIVWVSKTNANASPVIPDLRLGLGMSF